MRINKQEEEDSEIKDIFENSRKTTKSVTQNKNKYESDDDDDEEYPTVTSKTSSRAKNSKHSDNDDDDEELPVKPAKGPGLHLEKNE